MLTAESQVQMSRGKNAMGNEQYQRVVAAGASLKLSSWPGLHGLLHVPEWSLFTESEDSGEQCFLHLPLEFQFHESSS